MSVKKRMISEILLNMIEWYVAFENQRKNSPFYKLSRIQIQKNDNKDVLTNKQKNEGNKNLTNTKRETKVREHNSKTM